MGELMGTIFANEVIVISNVINEILINYYNRKDCHLIYNGVPEPKICDFPEYFHELGIEKRKYVLGMCRFVPEKNLHHLIEAFSKIDAKGCKLVLAGDTDFEDDYSLKLKQIAKEKGVILTGFIKGKKLHSLLSNTRCFILPSSHEGLPIALLEAMSYQIPDIVSVIPANLEVCLTKEAYFQCGNINELSEKIQFNIDNTYHQVKYNMRKYNWDLIASKVEDVYKRLK